MDHTSLCSLCTGDMTEFRRPAPYCLQCGASVWPEEEQYAGPDGALHAECLQLYLMEDATQTELMDFAEQCGSSFLQFMMEQRNLSPEAGRV